MPPQLLTLDEVADCLGVSRRTVERIVSRREVATVKVRGSRRVSEAALVAYVERVEVPALGSENRRPRASRSTGRLGEGPDPLAFSCVGE